MEQERTEKAEEAAGHQSTLALRGYFWAKRVGMWAARLVAERMIRYDKKRWQMAAVENR